MIETLTISNFQSHLFTSLQFTPGVNWIVGSSDSGKSAIIRALRWAWYNEPSGFSFRSHWERKAATAVTTRCSDGVEVTRSRTTSENSYTLNGHPLVAFGNDVPPEVQRAVNVSNVNIQSQGAGPFLLSMSAPEVARYLNNVANLSVIDEAHTRIAGKMRTCDADTNAQKAREIALEAKLEGFSDLDNVQALQEAATSQEARLEKLTAETAVLRDLLAQQERATARVQSLEGATSLSAASLRDTASAVQKKEAEVQTLRSCLSKLETATRVINAGDGIADAVKCLDEARQTEEKLATLTTAHDELARLVTTATTLHAKCLAFEGIDNLRSAALWEAHKELDAVLSKQILLQQLIRTDERLTTTIQTHLDGIAQLQKERAALIPDVCPLCGAPTCKTSH